MRAMTLAQPEASSRRFEGPKAATTKIYFNLSILSVAG
jgi:hypothetical protein